MKKYDDFDLDLTKGKNIEYSTGRQSDGCTGSCFKCSDDCAPGASYYCTQKYTCK